MRNPHACANLAIKVRVATVLITNICNKEAKFYKKRGPVTIAVTAPTDDAEQLKCTMEPVELSGL